MQHTRGYRTPTKFHFRSRSLERGIAFALSFDQWTVRLGNPLGPRGCGSSDFFARVLDRGRHGSGRE